MGTSKSSKVPPILANTVIQHFYLRRSCLTRVEVFCNTIDAEDTEALGGVSSVGCCDVDEDSAGY